MHKKLFVKQASLVNRKGPILLHDNGIGTLAKRWKKCIESNGNYFD
ncbi:hypothetical protein WH47_06024 [Habropoda laboriosa]|uniref:Histone-lysine N-methyltransferase SETMAR n=1 Tax=Habropoda laboriosa TaxID=597456 RepID=A0A0L7QRV7_9HYME|nr:hypothetical protein WH47_06024 [Habropoda laboriosa]